MSYSGFSYLIVEGIRNVFKNKKSSMSSLITMLCAMFLFGAFFAIGENINKIVDTVKMNQGMEVFMKLDATQEEIDEVGNKIDSLKGINTKIYKNKQQAMEQFREQFKDNPEILDGLLDEGLPTSYVITLTDLSLYESIKSEISTWDNIDKVTSNANTINTLMILANWIRLGIGIIFLLLLLISTTIISNTIKLTVHARRKEISIMKYVGATNGFIRGPFIVEGILIGLVAAVLTILVLALLYNVLTAKLATSDVFQKMGVSFLPFSDIINMIMIVFVGLGIGIGIIGSSISMKKYLDV